MRGRPNFSPLFLLTFLLFDFPHRRSAIDWGPIVTLGVQEDLCQHAMHTVVTINLAGSGLSEGPDIINLYLRAACMNLWNFLLAACTDVSIVVGCPGVGKSVEVYAYAMWQAKAVQKRVIYVHTHGDGYSIISTSGCNMRVGRIKLLDFETKPYGILQFIDLALEQGGVDIIVLDGQLQWLIKAVFSRLGRFRGVRLITCTSFQAFTKLSTETAAHAPAWSEFVMDSWKLKEYNDAFDNRALVLADQIPMTDVDEMFFYAGGSFRMMQWTLSRVIDTLNSKMRVVPSKSDLIQARGVGDGSQAAVNTLLSIHGGTSFVLSRFVLTSLFASVSNHAIATLRALLTDNPLWQGWVTELEVLTLIQNQQSIVFRNSSGQETWPRRGMVDSPLPTFFDSSNVCLTKRDADWLLPKRYNQECFDALYRVSPDSVRAIQITNADEHSCKLKYLIPFVESMNVHIVELVYVCRRSNFDIFKVPDPEQLTGSSKRATDEHEQFEKLLSTVTNIWEAKRSSGAGQVPPPTITVRHVTYQREDVDLPL